MIRLIDFILVVGCLLSGIINVTLAWEGLRRKRERSVTVLYLALMFVLSLNIYASFQARGPVHWGFYPLGAVFAGMLWTSLRQNIFRKRGQ